MQYILDFIINMKKIILLKYYDKNFIIMYFILLKYNINFNFTNEINNLKANLHYFNFIYCFIHLKKFFGLNPFHSYFLMLIKYLFS